MQKLTVKAKVEEKENGFVATVENLTPKGKGTTSKEAQDDLVDKFVAWVQSCEGQGTLETVLSEAGYVGVNESTELELELELEFENDGDVTRERAQ